MEWESIEKKWNEMTLRLRFPAVAGNASMTKGLTQTDERVIGAPSVPAPGRTAPSSDERSTV